MLEVNRDLIYAAAKAQRAEGNAFPLVVSVATFGRGVKQEFLQQLEPFRRSWGHNQSLVATPPREFLQPLLKEELPEDSQCFWAVGLAFGKSCRQQWRWDEEDGDAFF